VLLVSDGLDLSQGFRNASPLFSLYLDQAISEAQRRGVVIFPFFAPSAGWTRWNRMAVNYGQGALNRLADETGGEAFFSGSDVGAFDPYFKELNELLDRQWLITYRSSIPAPASAALRSRPITSCTYTTRRATARERRRIHRGKRERRRIHRGKNDILTRIHQNIAPAKRQERLLDMNSRYQWRISRARRNRAIAATINEISTTVSATMITRTNLAAPPAASVPAICALHSPGNN
jgi:hypothetical protein